VAVARRYISVDAIRRSQLTVITQPEEEHTQSLSATANGRARMKPEVFSYTNLTDATRGDVSKWIANTIPWLWTSRVRLAFRSRLVLGVKAARA
jgi:hypothetical protein